uniref:Uncharacterized protein n=1 Tax=Physcomitrium patens TaxID=3218 RepID=A0A2K1JZL6_PHYPA|nr:hypothetical protein PHYPA_014092 [Physcomitrium patens]
MLSFRVQNNQSDLSMFVMIDRLFFRITFFFYFKLFLCLKDKKLVMVLIFLPILSINWPIRNRW